jgi:hypothetical protein
MNKKNYHHFHLKHGFMLGRLGTTLMAVCSGYNVFLTDINTVFYQDPMRYVYKDAHIMVTSMDIPQDSKDYEHWGSKYMGDKPNQFVTLVSDLMYLRNTDITRTFAVTHALSSANSLLKNIDLQRGFLMIIFNHIMVERNLMLIPSMRYGDAFIWTQNFFLGIPGDLLKN